MGVIAIFIYPDNLTAKPVLWLWELKDLAVVGVGGLLSVLVLASSGFLLPLAELRVELGGDRGTKVFDVLCHKEFLLLPFSKAKYSGKVFEKLFSKPNDNCDRKRSTSNKDYLACAIVSDRI